MDLTALTLSVALGYSQYTDEEGPEPEAHFKVEVGHEESPLYAFGGYEQLDNRILGQALGELDIFSVGLGARKNIGDFFAFGEIGYGLVDNAANMVIQQEIVYTELVGRHERPFRPIPVFPQGPYDQDSYETVYEVDDGILGAIGVGYQPTESLSFTMAYRPFYVREHMEIYDEETRASGGGWWQESRSLDLSSWQLSARWTF